MICRCQKDGAFLRHSIHTVKEKKCPRVIFKSQNKPLLNHVVFKIKHRIFLMIIIRKSTLFCYIGH